MKTILIIIKLLCIGGLAANTGPEPLWVKQTPISRNPEFTYFHGVGIGSNRSEASSNAVGDAFVKAMRSWGSFEHMEQFIGRRAPRARINGSRVPHLVVCESPPIFQRDGSTKVFVLIKVPSQGGRSVPPPNSNIRCRTGKFYTAVRQSNDEVVRERQAESTRATRQNNSYYGVNLGTGLSFGLAGLNINWKQYLIRSFAICISLGVGLNRYQNPKPQQLKPAPNHNLNTEWISQPHISASLRIFPWLRNFYVGLSVGNAAIFQDFRISAMLGFDFPLLFDDHWGITFGVGLPSLPSENSPLGFDFSSFNVRELTWNFGFVIPLDLSTN